MGRENNLIVVAFDCSYSQFHIAGCNPKPKIYIINLAACVFECVLISGNLARTIDGTFGLRVFSGGQKLHLHIECAAGTEDI